MPVHVLVETMPYEELLGWVDYFEKRPIDWRADDRVYKVLQTQGVKAKPGEIFASLASIYNKPPNVSEDNKLDIKSFKKSFLFQKILSAEKGDKLDYD